MRASRVVLQLVLGPPAVLLAAASATAAIAAQWGRIDARFDLLAHFAPVWLIGATVALAVSFLFRGATRWTTVGLAVLGLAAALALMAPELIRDSGPKAPANAAGQLKIVQFNVWTQNPDPEAALRWLDEEKPDIVVIEEDPATFDAALSKHPRWRVACRHCQVLILSRRASLFAAPAREGPGGAYVASLTRAYFEDSRGPYTVIGVHNAWPTDADQPLQEARLAEAIGAADRDRLIVAGDFNSASWSFRRRYWDKAFGIPRRDKAMATWPAHRYGPLRWFGAPFLPIDHVYAGPGWATVSVRRGPRLSSDHYPVILTLAPVTPAPASPR